MALRKNTSLAKIEQMPSPHFSRIKDRQVLQIVVHSAECGETSNADRGVGTWFQNPASKVSAHYGVDNDSITQYVDEAHVAWHASQVNDWTIGIELAGKANQTREEWLDAYSLALLENAAELIADICRRYDIPCAVLGASEVKAKTKGIYGHAVVRVAYGSGTHWDPGQGFPWDVLIERVQYHLCNPPTEAA